MAYPSNISLPANAKYFGFVDSKLDYNPNYDINWSFQYSVIGNEFAFCTFLTNNAVISSGLPGQYVGYLGSKQYLTTESGEYILTENGERIAVGNLSGYDSNGLVAIAFDSTGLFALSSEYYPGVGLNQIKRNSLIIRDENDQVVFNQALSSLDTDFHLSSSAKYEQILRFRYANGNKLSIDYRIPSTEFKTLTSINFNFNIEPYDHVYPGFVYCSPISGLSAVPSTLYLKNFHTQGNTSPTTTETTEFIPITSRNTNVFTTLSGVSAYRLP